MDKLGDGISSENDKIELLEKARTELPKEYNIGILEELAQAYSEMAELSSDDEYYTKAIQVFEQIKNQGMGSYDTDYNLTVLYQNIQEYAKASELLNQMLNEYGEMYKTYKAMAFLEVAIQGKLDQSQRDYTDFQTDYLKAEELYQQQLSNNANDVEMDRLEELYTQALSNGWL
jgi:serine/threonine-protein kinase